MFMSAMATEQKEKLGNTSNKGRFFKTGFIVGVSALVLAACGSSDAPKEEYLNAYKDVHGAKTIDSSHEINIDADKEGTIDIHLDSKSDKENEKQEVAIKINSKLEEAGLNLDVNLPIYVEKDKAYTTGKGFGDLMGEFMGLMGMPFSLDIPDKYADKLIELDADTMDMSGGLGAIDPDPQTSDFDFGQEYMEFLESFDEKDFTKEKDIVTLKVDGEKFKNTFAGIIEEMGLENPMGQATFEGAAGVAATVNGEGVSGDASALDNYEFGEVKITALIQKDKLVGEKFRIPVTVTEEDEALEYHLEILNEYNEIDGKLDFTFDIKEENLITIEDLIGDLFGDINME